MLDLRQVLSFVTIAEKRSFTQAAETLEIAQSAVSQHIRRLEDQLQLTLLTRNSRSVALSADGQAMLPHAQALLDSEQNILAAARALLLAEPAPGAAEEAAAEEVVAEELSPRELQVAQMVSRGMSNKDIASALVLSTRTVEGHVARILTKLGFKSRVEIGLWARDR